MSTSSDRKTKRPEAVTGDVLYIIPLFTRLLAKTIKETSHVVLSNLFVTSSERNTRQYSGGGSPSPNCCAIPAYSNLKGCFTKTTTNHNAFITIQYAEVGKEMR